MKLESVLSALLSLAAVATAGALVHREFFASKPLLPGVRRHAEYIPSWQEILRLQSSHSAPLPNTVSVVVFDDMECPACKQFQVVADSAERLFGGEVEFVFAHFPLPMHRFARAAAVAAECGRESNRFQPLVSAIFRKQDSIGLRPWSSYAVDAMILDTSGFMECTRRPGMLRRVDESREWGVRAKINFTPSVMINGWMLRFVPTFEEFVSLLRSFQGGNLPFDGDGNMNAKLLGVYRVSSGEQRRAVAHHSVRHDEFCPVLGVLRLSKAEHLCVRAV
jgi:hypothetical protein